MKNIRWNTLYEIILTKSSGRRYPNLALSLSLFVCWLAVAGPASGAAVGALWVGGHTTSFGGWPVLAAYNNPNYLASGINYPTQQIPALDIYPSAMVDNGRGQLLMAGQATNIAPGTLRRYDASTGTNTAEINLGPMTPLSIASMESSFSLAFIGGLSYHSSSYTVETVDLFSRTGLNSFSLGTSAPTAMAWDDSNQMLWIGQTDSSGASSLQAYTLDVPALFGLSLSPVWTAAANINIGSAEPTALAIDNANGLLWMGSGSPGSFLAQAFSLATPAYANVHTIFIGGFSTLNALAVDPWTQTVGIGGVSSNLGIGEVRTYDASSGQLVMSMTPSTPPSLFGPPEAIITPTALAFQSPAPVPLPGAFWLFGFTLGLLGWIRRKVSF